MQKVRFDQERGLTHEEYRSFKPPISRLPDLVKYLGVGDILFDGDLKRGSGHGVQAGWNEGTVFDSWIIGPSAEGSENGTPSSMMSAPPRSMASMMSTVSLAAG